MSVVLFLSCALLGVGDTPDPSSLPELQAELQPLRSLIEKPAGQGDADAGPTDVWAQRIAALSGPLSLLIYILVIRPVRIAHRRRAVRREIDEWIAADANRKSRPGKAARQMGGGESAAKTAAAISTGVAGGAKQRADPP